jgi:hypothetical protein
VLWLLEFTRDEHRYRAELRSEPGAPSSARQPTSLSRGIWFVSMDGGPPHPAFEADVRDEDTEEFRGRIVSAARGERVDPGEYQGTSSEEGRGTSENPRRPRA